MKNLMFIFCIMLFSSVAASSPVGDVEYGYSAISITSGDGLIGNVSNVADVGESSETAINAWNTNKSMAMPTIGASAGAFDLNANRIVTADRSLPTEVGWRISITI